jgi:hypothetical protein
LFSYNEPWSIEILAYIRKWLYSRRIKLSKILTMVMENSISKTRKLVFFLLPLILVNSFERYHKGIRESRNLRT